MKALVETIWFLLAIPFLLVMLPIAMVGLLFGAIFTLIFGGPDNPTGPVRRILTIAAMLGTGVFVAYEKYTAEPVKISSWESSDECFSEHLTQSDGGFSYLNDDNFCDLIRYCNWAYLTKQHDLSDIVHETAWQWALHGVGMERSKRLQKYFSPSRGYPFDESCYDIEKKQHDKFKQKGYSAAVIALRNYRKETICGIRQHKSTTANYLFFTIMFKDYVKDIEASIDKEISHLGQDTFCLKP